MNKNVLLLSLPLLLLASCNGEPAKLTAQEVVDQVASESNLGVTDGGQLLRIGEDKSNTLPAGTTLNFQKLYQVDLGDGTMAEAQLTWTVDPAASWNLFSNSKAYIAAPMVDGEEFSSVFTGTISYEEATATVKINVTLLA